MKKSEEFAYNHLTCTLPRHISAKLEQFNRSAEIAGELKIGRSFVIRFALEELFKRSDARNVVIERKIDSLRGRELA